MVILIYMTFPLCTANLDLYVSPENEWQGWRNKVPYVTIVITITISDNNVSNNTDDLALYVLWLTLTSMFSGNMSEKGSGISVYTICYNLYSHHDFRSQ